MVKIESWCWAWAFLLLLVKLLIFLLLFGNLLPLLGSRLIRMDYQKEIQVWLLLVLFLEIILAIFSGVFLWSSHSFFCWTNGSCSCRGIWFDKGWHNLWLESDSMLVIHYLQNRSLNPPWQIRNRWLNCLSMISSMSFHFSHIYREGNEAADALANLGLLQDNLSWWESPPLAIRGFLYKDLCGVAFLLIDFVSFRMIPVIFFCMTCILGVQFFCLLL